MVKEPTVPSGSVPPNPGILALLSGNKVTLELLATGGWLTLGGNRSTVAGVGLMPPLLSVAL